MTEKKNTLNREFIHVGDFMVWGRVWRRALSARFAASTARGVHHSCGKLEHIFIHFKFISISQCRLCSPVLIIACLLNGPLIH